MRSASAHLFGRSCEAPLTKQFPALNQDGGTNKQVLFVALHATALRPLEPANSCNRPKDGSVETKCVRMNPRALIKAGAIGCVKFR